MAHLIRPYERGQNDEGTYLMLHVHCKIFKTCFRQKNTSFKYISFNQENLFRPFYKKIILTKYLDKKIFLKQEKFSMQEKLVLRKKTLISRYQLS